MWRLLAVIIALAGMIALPLKAADTSLSNLNAGVAVSGTDLFYDVQTVGVGGVKVTGSQIKSFFQLAPSFSGNVTFLSLTGVTQCLQVNGSGLVSGTATSCGGTNAVSSVANTDGSLGIAPTTGSVIASLSPAFAVTWTTAQTFNSGLTSTTGVFTSALTASGSSSFQTTTVANISGSTQCIQANTAGTLSGTGSSCGSGQFSIAAGSNILTSGTANNITVSVLTSPSFTNLTATNRGFISALTGSSLNFVSGTVTTLTSTNGSIAVLTGSSVNFVSGTITTFTSTNAWITNLTATGTGSIAALTGSSVNFVSGTITTITHTNAWTTNLTATGNGSITTLTGGSATFQTVTVNSLTPTGPMCLQETNGVIQATNVVCGTGSVSGGAPGAVALWSGATVLTNDIGITFTSPGQLALNIQNVSATTAFNTNPRAISIIGTWNSSGAAFDAPLFMNITNTASAVPSYLMDFQISGQTILNFQVDTLTGGGALAIPGQTGLTATFTPTLEFLRSNGSRRGAGLVSAADDEILIVGASTNKASAAQSVLFLYGSTSPVSSKSDVAADTFSLDSANQDTILQRDGAGIIAQRNGTNAQNFRLYNTSDAGGSNPTNFERGIIDWTTTTNVFTMGVQSGGTGSGRDVAIITRNASNNFGAGINLKANDTNPQRWQVGGDAYPPNNSPYILATNSPNNGTMHFKANEFHWDEVSVANDTWVINPASSSNAGNLVSTAYFLNWAGEARVTTDASYTSTTTLANITGMTVNLLVNRTYNFTAEIPWTDASAGGLQLAMSGTVGATNVIYDGYIIDSGQNGIKGNVQATSMGTAVANSATTGTAGHARISGTITVNTAGTLTVQAAQFASSGTPTTIKRGASLIVHDIP